MVQTNTVQGPGGEAGVMRIKGSGTPGHERGLAMALAGNSRWCYLDPKLGAMHAVAEAARKVACTGATPVAATNCLNFGNPEKPEIMAQLSAAIDGISEACLALGTPITGGNVSLYNETRGEGIYPTPVIGIVGIIEDVSKAVPADFQEIGDDVLLLIFQGDDEEPSHKPSLEQQFGSSEFAKHLLHGTWGVPPGLSLRDEANLHRGLAALANSRLLHSASDAADGGVLVAVAECMFAKGIGFESSKPFRFGYAPDPRPLEYVMQWNELSSTVVVSCDSSNTERVIQIAQEHGATGAYRIGTTVPHRFILHGSGGDSPDIDASLSELKAAWSGTLNSLLTEVNA
jgi:phosphoribosylformylglycinamidine synthase